MRWWHKLLLAGLLLMTLSVAAVYGYWQKTLAALPVQNLKFDIHSLSLHQLQLSNLSFRLDAAASAVRLENLTVSWQFPTLFQPQLQQIKLGRGEITLTQWPEKGDSAAPPSGSWALPDNWQLPGWLPADINLQQLQLNLPCGDTRCEYLFDIQLKQRPQLTLQLNAYDSTSADTVRLAVLAHYQAPDGLPLLNAQLSLDDTATLSVQQTLTRDTALRASGELNLNIAPPSDWLQQQLTKWQLTLPPDALAQFTAPVSVTSRWQFDVPEQRDLASISQHASGNWQLSANLPAPLTIPGVGQLQGHVSAELMMTNGVLSQYQLNSQLALLEPQLPDSLSQQGISAQALRITLNTDGNSQPQLTAVPLRITLSSEGKSKLDLSADATLNLTPPISAILRHGKLSLAQQHLVPAAQIKLEQLQLNSSFNAYWLSDSWQLDLADTRGSLRQLSLPQTQVKDITLTLAPSQFRGDSAFTTLQLNTELNLSAQQLQHPLLKPLNWQWQGKLQGDLVSFNAHGTVSNSASLGITHQLSYQPDNLKLNWQLDDIFLLAGNPLHASFTDWPALLELNRGRVAGSGEFSLSPHMAAKASITLSGVSGIYDRSLFKDLTAPLKLNYQDDTVEVATTESTLSEIQHGITVGPVRLTADYTASANMPTAGKLNIQQLQMLAMGGQVQVRPTRLDLTLTEQEVVLQLQRIDLSQLLQQHPTTDLSGNGRISGTIPVLFSRSGTSVKSGHIAAESPGGKLQYRPPAAKNMAAGNPGMKVVLEALDDFHYSVLSSNVSYDTQGKLTLGLNLQGRNPTLEAGRAVNLNINLEEDIPAMLTSLQLSSQISDKIKQRVQQHLQQSGAKRANGVKP
jgi:hypothetical protein